MEDIIEFDTQQKFNNLKIIASVTHANINIKAGNIFQNEIYKVVKDSGKYEEVIEEHPIEISNSSRKKHKVDIFCKNKNKIIAINSKGKSFNNTESAESKLQEYNLYLIGIQEKYPEIPKENITYIILKDEYSPFNSKMSTYHYLNSKGIRVYNTEKYLEDNFNCDFKQLEKRRQEKAVSVCEAELGKLCDVKKLYQLFNNF